MSSPRPIDRLLDVMTALRDRDGGCPWDRIQTFASIAPYTIEEAYEVADAIGRNDMKALVDELGDLLFQVVFHAEMAREAGAFEFDDVASAIVEKMIRRHPHVFAETEIDSADQQSRAWEEIKAEERAARGADEKSALSAVPASLPSLLRAAKLQARAARVRFDWSTASDVVPKLREELDELERAMAEAGPGAEGGVREEVGDLLFSVVNLARHLGVDPDRALREANLKFESRFREMERRLTERNRSVEDATADELEALWREAKAAGRIA